MNIGNNPASSEILPANTDPSPAVPAPEHSPAFAVATQPSYARTLFFAPDGLRPGWGFAFYLFSFFTLQHLAVDLAWLHDFGANGLWSDLLEDIGNVLAAFIPAMVLARVERRPWGLYGLPVAAAFRRTFWVGIAWGFAAVSLLIFSLYTFHVFDFGHVVLHSRHIPRFAAYWA